jgi:type VI secretion system protein VasD
MPFARRRWIAGATVLLLPGCGLFGEDEPPPPPPPPPPPAPPPPTKVSVMLRADDDVNAAIDGTGRPLQVRLLQLAGVNEFMEADFFALDADPKAALGDAFIKEERETLTPGKLDPWQRTLEEGTRFLGVMAAYRDVGTAQWRTYVEVPRNQTTLYEARFGATGVRLAEAGL